MEGKSTHGLRLDQLADLLGVAVADDSKPQDESPKAQDEGQKTAN